jgi:hypothetical protein
VGNDGAWIFYSIKSVGEIRIDVDSLGCWVGRKIVLQVAESTEDCRVSCVFRDGDSNCFFTASWTNKNSREFLLNDANYPASSSSHSTLHCWTGASESIFTFGRGSSRSSFESGWKDTPSFSGCRAVEASE